VVVLFVRYMWGLFGCERVGAWLRSVENFLEEVLGDRGDGGIGLAF